MIMKISDGKTPIQRRPCFLPIVCSLFLIYLETVFIYEIFGRIEWQGYLSCLFFSISGGLLLAVLSTLGHKRLNKAILLVFFLVLSRHFHCAARLLQHLFLFFLLLFHVRRRAAGDAILGRYPEHHGRAGPGDPGPSGSFACFFDFRRTQIGAAANPAEIENRFGCR